MAMHRVRTREGIDDDRCYASAGRRLLGPFDSQAAATRAIDRAAAAVAIEYAGLDCTIEEALEETFGTAEPGDERDRLTYLYYNSALNLLDGAEESILEKMIEHDDELQTCNDWVCTVCDDEWTGPSPDCHSCELHAADAAEAETEAAREAEDDEEEQRQSSWPEPAEERR